jgi:hypothetical protein
MERRKIISRSSFYCHGCHVGRVGGVEGVGGVGGVTAIGILATRLWGHTAASMALRLRGAGVGIRRQYSNISAYSIRLFYILRDSLSLAPPALLIY